MKVLAGGYFDILHVGHVRFLEKAASFGELHVLVADSEMIEDRETVMNQEERIEIVSSLEAVDGVLEGPASESKMWGEVDKEGFDLFVAGYDQDYYISKVKEETSIPEVRQLERKSERSSSGIKRKSKAVSESIQ